MEQRPRILVVDTAVAGPLVARLLDAEFHVITVDTWNEAVQCLHDDRPDALIVGYHFDGMRAYRFINHVRHDPAGERLGILVVRGSLISMKVDDAALAESYRAVGADDYVALDKAAQAERFADEAKRLCGAVRRLLTDYSYFTSL